MDEVQKRIFEQVKRHLFDQGVKCTKRFSQTCMYRNEDGLKCAIGVLIPDDQYSISIEGIMVTHLKGNNMWVTLRRPLETTFGRALTPADVDMLDKLQRIHDHVDPPDWPDALDKLEKELS